jgi:hypothetical protein
MKNYIYRLALSILSSIAYSTENIYSTGDTEIDIKAIIGVQTCMGGGSCSQNQTLNAIGTSFSIDPAKETFINLGKITGPTKKKLQIPSKIGKRTLYSFTSENGAKFYIGLEMKTPPEPGKRSFTIKDTHDQTLKAGKDFNIVELYRSDNSRNEWLRNSVLFIKRGKMPYHLPVDLLPDGSLKIAFFEELS